MGWIFNWRLWAVIFVGFMLYKHPGSSADIVHQGLGKLSHAGDSLGTFVSRL